MKLKELIDTDISFCGIIHHSSLGQLTILDDEGNRLDTINLTTKSAKEVEKILKENQDLEVIGVRPILKQDDFETQTTIEACIDIIVVID